MVNVATQKPNIQKTDTDYRGPGVKFQPAPKITWAPPPGKK
jgi:hypothetical protein